jgi:hypothetical protein
MDVWKVRRIRVLSRFSRVLFRLTVIAMSILSGCTRPINARLMTLSVSALALVTISGCAQIATPGYYDPPASNSISDSQHSATGANARQIVRAPSQLQISTDRPARHGPQDAPTQHRVDLAALPAAAAAGAQTIQVDQTAAQNVAIGAGDNATAAPGASAYHSAAARFAPHAQTYLGTLPCLTPDVNCAPIRMTLTLAPNGRWRARSETLATGPNALAAPAVLEQGCWDAIEIRPVRVLLTDGLGTTRADFVVQDNALRVRSMNGQAPNLGYFMTRQPDLDPISELDGSKPPSCD